MTLNKNIKYVGTDPFKKSYDSNVAMYSFYKDNLPTFNMEADLYNLGSEDFKDEKYIGKVNVAFSSPPYYNKEVYCDDETQAYFNGYCKFINNWWNKTVSNINDLLCEDGTFIVNIKDEMDGFNLSDDMLAIAKRYGFEVVDTYYIQLSKNLIFAGKKDKHKMEPVYILKRTK